MGYGVDFGVLMNCVGIVDGDNFGEMGISVVLDIFWFICCLMNGDF